MVIALIVFAFHVSVVISFVISACCNHEGNIVITGLKALRGLLWPYFLVRYIRKNWPVAVERLKRDWRKAFPCKRAAIPSRVDVSTLGTSEPKHMPGRWMDH